MKHTKYVISLKNTITKIVTTVNVNLFNNKLEVDFYIFSYSISVQEWELITDKTANSYDKSLRGLSVHDWILTGRNSQFYYVTPAQILRACNEAITLYIEG